MVSSARGRRVILGDAELRPLSPGPQIMCMPAVRQFTIAEVDAFPEDGNRYELLYGMLLVTPQAGLPHQDVAAQLTAALGTFLGKESEVRIWSPGAIRVHPDLSLEPDILIGERPLIAKWEEVARHWLAVEISGVASKITDREYKRDAYLGLGVAEVWLVDLKEERIYVSRAGGPKDVPHDRELTWRSPGGRELVLDIPALFRGVARGE